MGEKTREGTVKPVVAAGNEASVALHRKLGFEEVGLMREIGWKFDRWLDLIVMERLL
jgi:phosphinothricin acetyltransferase